MMLTGFSFPFTHGQFKMGLEAFEKTLNVIGYFDDKYTPQIRSYYGIAQIIAGYAISLILLSGYTVSKVMKKDAAADLFFDLFISDLFMPYALHGMANVIRASLQKDNPLLLLIYDLCINRFSYL